MVNSENTPEKYSFKTILCLWLTAVKCPPLTLPPPSQTKQTNDTASWQFCALARSCFKMCTETAWDDFCWRRSLVPSHWMWYKPAGSLLTECARCLQRWGGKGLLSFHFSPLFWGMPTAVSALWSGSHTRRLRLPTSTHVRKPSWQLLRHEILVIVHQGKPGTESPTSHRDIRTICT